MTSDQEEAQLTKFCAVCQTLEKCFEFNIDVLLLFIDYRQAFDSIHRLKLLDEMESFGIPRILETSQKLNSEAIVINGGRMSLIFKRE